MTVQGFGKIEIISIHAPVKGATKQPKPKVEFVEISIHAPVKGATQHSG